MIVKFTNKSERVKGLSFHPQRPWLLTGLHTGNIQLWDYRLQTVIENFNEHEGPVRSVQFHQSLSLFASGGDDFTVRVWNYKTKKCNFILKGHLDFVRCVCFHPELPWVLSSSDDQTARVWNYQSRQMIALITGHSHYVMQCQFHPNKDLLLTCSLDQTVRLWSFAPLKKKYTSKSSQDQSMSGSEIELMQIMEGHNAGVNWCSFHHSQNFIVSGADDKKIKIWKYSDTRCWEFDQLNGHMNNVSSIIYHPKAEVLISNSEDKTTRVWDSNKRIEVDCFTNKELDRFWVVSAHPDNFYFASGSDSALYVFTLFKDRPPMALVNDLFLCIGNRKIIKMLNLKTKNEAIIKDLAGLSNVQDNLLIDNIEQIQHNQYETSKIQILIRLKTSSSKSSSSVAKYIFFQDVQSAQNGLKDMKMFLARSAAFIGKNKLVRVKENRELEIYNYEIDQTQSIHMPDLLLLDRVFQAPGGKVIFYANGQLILMDSLQKKIINQIETTTDMANLKQIVWNQTHTFFAAITKKCIVIYTKNFTKVCSLNEKINIKSAIWIGEGSSILIFTTKAQLKYLILNGDSGLIKSTENILYLAKVDSSEKNHLLIGMDNQQIPQFQTVDFSEPFFKQALYQKSVADIKQFLNSKKFLGDSLVSYLYKKNYPSLAINLVQDKKGWVFFYNYIIARFSLAIDSNNLEVAYKTSLELKEKGCYQLLYQEAMRQGNHNLSEISLQQLKEFDKLSFFYITLGNRENLKKMVKIAESRSNNESLNYNALLLGDIQTRIQILYDSGQYSLAYLSAITHGLEDLALSIKNKLNYRSIWVKSQKPKCLISLTPIVKKETSSNLA